MKFVWKGWQDPYDSLSIPTLLDGDKVVWQGRYYYSGESRAGLREEMLKTCLKYGMPFPSDFESMEDQRTWSDMG